ncbi:MAG: hypothetical protein IGS38_11850 [Synechococcales cyanobacterium M58_A2018_015]|nr:hypothetical protein [Synechococcales cyanobacterium M58_A2018_015]
MNTAVNTELYAASNAAPTVDWSDLPGDPVYSAEHLKLTDASPDPLLDTSPDPLPADRFVDEVNASIEATEPVDPAVDLAVESAAGSPLSPIANNEPESVVEPADATEPSPVAQADAPTQLTASWSPPTPSDRWQFSVEPYFFIPLDVHADVTVSGRSTSLDLGLGDILDLDRVFDGGLRLEAQRDRWGIILDGFYVFAEQSGGLGQTFSSGSLLQFVRQTAPGRLEQFTQRFSPERLQQVAQLGRQIGLNTPVRVTARGTVSVRQITADAAVSYRVIDTALDNSPQEPLYPRFVLAPLVGVRTNFLRQTIEVDTVRIDGLPIPDDAIPPIDRSFRLSRTLVDPLVGAQFGVDLSDRWSLGLRGDVSGFNIGADQNWTWNLLAGVQYRLSRLASLQLAYRFNGFDFEDGEGLTRAKLNLRQNGLWLSAVFRF